MFKIGLVYEEDGKYLQSTIVSKLNKMNSSIKLITIRLLEHMLERGNHHWNFDVLVIVVNNKLSNESKSFYRNLKKCAKKNKVILINIDDNRIKYRKKRDFMELYINSKDIKDNSDEMNDIVLVINNYLEEIKVHKRNEQSNENGKKTEILIILLGIILILEPLILLFVKNELGMIEKIISILTVMVSVLITVYTGLKVYHNENEYISFYKKLDSYLTKPENKNLMYNETQSTIKKNLDKNTLDYEKKNSCNFQDEVNSDEYLKKEKNEIKSDLVNNDKANKENINILRSSSYSPLGHLQFNMGQMWEYHKMGIKQSKISFYMAIAFAFLGIVIIVFALISPIIINNVEASIRIATAISGIILELFAGTIMIIYNKTIVQTNIFYDSITNSQDYLSRLNIVKEISSLEKRDEMYEYLIKNGISFNENKKKNDNGN